MTEQRGNCWRTHTTRARWLVGDDDGNRPACTRHLWAAWRLARRWRSLGLITRVRVVRYPHRPGGG